MLKGLLWAIIVVLSIPALLYVPFIQDFVKDIALKEASKATGMTIEIEHLRLKFPLRIDLGKARVIEASGDTMLQAAYAAIDVKPIPLLKGDISASGIQLRDARYQLGTPDSTLYLTALIRHVEVDASDIRPSSSLIRVGNATLDGGIVDLTLKEDSTSAPVDTAQATPWEILAKDIYLKDITYRMKMMPTIDSLGTHIGSARLINGTVNIGARQIHAQSLSIDSVDATYLTPTQEYLARHPATPAPTDTLSATQPWTIRGNLIRLSNAKGTYAIAAATPSRGLDMDYLSATDINIDIDSFYNQGTTIRIPLKRLTATERCGVKMTASGTFTMDSTQMTASGFDLSTLFSSLKFDASMGIGDIMADPTIPLSVKGIASIGIPDLELAMPALKPLLRHIPRYNDLTINMDIDGTSRALDIHDLKASLPHHLDIALNGHVQHPLDIKKLSGDIAIKGRINNIDFIKPTVLDARLAKTIQIPPLSLNGNMKFSGSNYNGRLQAVTGSGRLAMNGKWTGNSETYRLALSLDSFPANAIMPTLGIGTITASLKAEGKGLDIATPNASLSAEALIRKIIYGNTPYKDIHAWCHLENGDAHAGLVSLNDNADFDVLVDGRIEKDSYTFNMDGTIRELDLLGLKLSPTQSRGSLSFNASGDAIPSHNTYRVDLTLSDLEWQLPDMDIRSERISTTLNASDTLILASLSERDLEARFAALCSLDTLFNRFAKVSTELDKQIAKRRIDVERFQQTMPRFNLSVNGGDNNIATEYLSASKMGFRSIQFNARNDSLLTFGGKILGLRSGDMRLDTISMFAAQHRRFLVYNASIDNKRGTMDNFAHVTANGYLADDKIALFLKQRNINDSVGFHTGMLASIADSTVTVRLSPYTPVIGYKKWKVNADNFIVFNPYTSHVDANLHMKSADSRVSLYTEHVDSIHTQEDVVLDIANLHLSDWLSFSPFAPPLTGEISSQMRFAWDQQSIGGNGNISINNLTYGRDRVGSFRFDVDLSTNTSGTVLAKAYLMVDSIRTVSIEGALNDSTRPDPFSLDLHMIRFPLRVVNPFLPRGTASLKGMLNGDIDITGEMARPIFNGSLSFDTASIKVDMLGSSFHFDDIDIPIDSNVISFNDYKIHGMNKNPLRINGSVDIHDLSSPDINLALNARNMQIVNSDKAHRADVYGKAFIDLDAYIWGDMSMLGANAALNLLPESNVTYVMADARQALTSQNTGQMVQFVQFTDSVAMAQIDSVYQKNMAMALDVALKVSEGATINVDLSADGKNKVRVQGNGNLNYTMSAMGDSRFSGRYTIENGFARYTPPLMSEKLFNFVSGSYIGFNGDMTNPILDLHAVETLKTNVTREGQNSEIINFDISLGVTGTLSNMNIAFDLSTKDDISIANELQSMSAEQRANQAMNLLLYNTYTGAGTKANANLAGNPLFSFVESQVNSWAANNIKWVDVSFGIDQYDSNRDGTTSTTTSYSYRVSKTLFNDRFKIVVGGNYSTDANADENLSQNLINDISFEYMLNRSRSMYVRLFRHVGYESILEGEITQTGVGFVYRRKLRSLRDLFRRTPSKPRPVPVVQRQDSSAIVPKTDNAITDETK